MYDNFCVTKIKYIMHNVQDHNLFCDNAARPVVGKGSCFIKCKKKKPTLS